VFDVRLVGELAEKGIEAADLASVCGLVGRLQAEPDLRRRFDAAVSEGHARHRAALASKLHMEAAVKGKASALLAAAKGWLSRYAETMTPEVEGGIAERLVALVGEIREHRTQAAADASS
jgi:hypothetical protein